MPRMSAPSAKILIFSCARATLDSLTDELHDSVSARFGGLRRARTADDDETRFVGGEVQVEAHGTLARDPGEQVGDVSVGGVPNLRRAAAGDGGADRLRFRALVEEEIAVGIAPAPVQVFDGRRGGGRCDEGRLRTRRL